MIVSDLDGTLLRSDQSLSDKTLDVLSKCQKAGIKLVLASARPPRMTRNILPKGFGVQAIINYNGAWVSDAGQVIYQQTLGTHSIKAIVGDIRQRIPAPSVCFETNDTLYANFDITNTFGSIPYQRIDLDSFEPSTVHKIILCNMKRQDKSAILSSLPQDCTCMVTDADQIYQIMGHNVSKFNSLQFILDRHGIGAGDIMCFGDDHNDVELLMNCGVSVAMGNAIPFLKQIAKHTTHSNEENGVASFIEQYLGF